MTWFIIVSSIIMLYYARTISYHKKHILYILIYEGIGQNCKLDYSDFLQVIDSWEGEGWRVKSVYAMKL